MKLKRTALFEGLAIPIAELSSPTNDEIPLSDADMQRFKGVWDLHKSAKAVFMDRLGRPILVGAEIRMALLPDSSLAGYTLDQFWAQLELTADQLTKNAEVDSPLPHKRALTHVAMGGLIERASCAHRKSGTTLVVCSGGRRKQVPVLDPTAFVEPCQPDQLRMTGSFDITGVKRCWKTNSRGLYIGENVLLVELPSDDAKWCWESIRDVLEQPTQLIGTLVRSSKSSPWHPEAGARLEGQRLMKEVDKTEAA